MRASWLSSADASLFRVERVFALIGGCAVLGLMFIAVISVGGRNILQTPLSGYVDWIEQLVPVIAFLGISYTQRLGGHIRMDIILSRLHGRARWSLEMLTTLVALCVMVLLTYGSFAHFDRSFDFSAPLWSRDSSIDIGIPLWPAKLLAPLAFGLLCARLAIHFIGFGIGVITNTPVAVPQLEDAAEVAAKEVMLVNEQPVEQPVIKGAGKETANEAGCDVHRKVDKQLHG